MEYSFLKNIFSVGCSFTEGTGVKIQNNYTSELAKLLKFNAKNYAMPGQSNQYIFRKTIELLKNWNNDDILIIQWTSPTRDEIVTREGYTFTAPFSDWYRSEFITGINTGNAERDLEIISKYKNKVIDYSYDFFYKEYQLNLSFCFQFALFGLLERLEVKYIMFDGWDFEKSWEFGNTEYKNKNTIRKYTNEKYLNDSFGNYTNTPINEHPNTEGHLHWAKYLYEKIIKLNYYTIENKLI